MPVIDDGDYRVKVALGESNGVLGAASPSTPMTILNGTIQPRGTFSHGAESNKGIWIQAVEGSLHVVMGETTRHLDRGQAIAVKTSGSTKIVIGNPSREPVQFTLFDGVKIDEAYVQDGPFVMGSSEEIADIRAAYEAGQLGSIEENR